VYPDAYCPNNGKVSWHELAVSGSKASINSKDSD
jgi:hypothetical protein